MISFLKKTGWLLVIIAGGAGYFVWAKENAPCVKPIQYHIGTFDTRFGISKADFLSATAKASAIWESPIQDTSPRNLFEYDAKNNSGDLVINLVYDDRQKTTQQAQVLKADLAKTNALAQSLKTEYTALEDEYNVAEAQYKSDISKFQSAQDTYNTNVQYWNSRGGAPKQEYQKLTQEKNDLMAQASALESQRQKVNSLADQINTFINKYNLLVKDANTNINTINSTAGKEFEEGQYNPNTNEIDIYEFSDSLKLKRVLAHELGHALGLDHNSNSKSIMYALNISTNDTLSPDDLAALKVRCNLQ